jgi:hypothetical protein
MSNNKKSASPKLASLAAKILQDPNSSNIKKELAGSALSQSKKNNQTGAQTEDKAAKVLASEKCSETKALAASVLSQSNKER